MRVSALICGVCGGEGGCSCWSLERKGASSVCWQPPIDCRPSAGCSSEPMALLRRLLALSCDRHMRNATAVSALICGVCEGEGGCSCWSLERKGASSVCWQPPIDCRPSAGCSSEPMALLRRLLALSCDRHMRNATAVSALICGVCGGEGGCSCWSLERKGGVVGLLAATNRLQAVCWVQ